MKPTPQFNTIINIQEIIESKGRAIMDQITLMDIFKFCGQHIIEVIAFISIFVEIAPIKLHPISFILDIINKPVREDISKMSTDIDEKLNAIESGFKNDLDKIQKRQDQEEEQINSLIKNSELSEIARIRWSILEFANSINNGNVHTRDEYRHIKDENDRYHALNKKYHIKNGLLDEEMAKINKHYEENKDKSSVYF